jgi:hypothetical protein
MGLVELVDPEELLASTPVTYSPFRDLLAQYAGIETYPPRCLPRDLCSSTDALTFAAGRYLQRGPILSEAPR